MAGATEIAYLPINQEKLVGQKFKDVLQTILQQEGCQGLSWGVQVENPSITNLFIDWDSVDDHKKFIASPQYKPFGEELMSLLDEGAPSLYHVHFDPHPPSAPLADGNATEFITMYFPTDYSAADQATFDENIRNFFGGVEGSAEGFKGASHGWVVEELKDPKSGELSKAYVILIGWTSVAAHMAYRETQSFKDNIHYLREAKDLKGLGVCHVHAQKADKI